MVPRPPKGTKRLPKREGPRRPKGAPRKGNEAKILPKGTQNGPKMVPNGAKTVEKSLKKR